LLHCVLQALSLTCKYVDPHLLKTCSKFFWGPSEVYFWCVLKKNDWLKPTALPIYQGLPSCGEHLLLWVELCPAKREIDWSHNPQHFRMWLYLEIRHWQKSSSWLNSLWWTLTPYDWNFENIYTGRKPCGHTVHSHLWVKREVWDRFSFPAFRRNQPCLDFPLLTSRTTGE
jgi:hypothetical protein